MRLTRRRLLVDGLSLSALAPITSLARPRGVGRDERVLVVLELTGGNDGLNTVVPHRQDPYFRLRPTLALEPGKLHALDSEHGLHPALAPLGRLFAEGALTVLHGVGCPAAGRSHFRALEVWHSADPHGNARGVGWLGRLADQLVAREPGAMPALFVGTGELPLALRGRTILPPALERGEDLRLRSLEGFEDERARVVSARGGGDERAFLRAAARDAYAAAGRLEAVVARPGGTGYPDLPLARALRLVARLVTGGFDTRLFMLRHGGFDTHARQAATHAARLDELGRGLAAFQEDLAAAGCERRVLTVVYSEFGRRAAENASRGTDHGAAAPVLLLGGERRVSLAGTPPDLMRLEDGDVACTTDFRTLYADLECAWMGLEPSSALAGLGLVVSRG